MRDWSLAPFPTDEDATAAADWTQRVDHVAETLLASDEALRDPRWRRRQLSPGLGSGCRVIFEDHSEIPMSPPDTHTLEYRMSWLARSDDVVGLAGARVPAFEDHLASSYGLGRPRYVRARPSSLDILADRFAEDDVVMSTLVGLAAAGGLSIVPYISTAPVWLLAEQLAERTGRDVRVAGPPPDLTSRVNNKLWFAQRVRELIGPEALPRTHVASDNRELVSHLDSLATLGRRIVVKVTAGAGGRGIVTCEAASIAPGRVEATALGMCRQLEAGGWDGSFPLVVGLWDEPIAGSPSVQVWIPDVRDGPPVVEATFDQVLDDARFIGAAESVLPVPTRARLANDAMGLAVLLQRLGYFGRCSFDSVLVGEDPGTAEIHWLECNGRWGGVSTAMSALQRLVGNRPDRSLAIVQSEAPLGRPRSFEDVVQLVDDDLLHTRPNRTGAIILSPRRVMAGTGLNLGVVGHTRRAAQETASRVLHRLDES